MRDRSCNGDRHIAHTSHAPPRPSPAQSQSPVPAILLQLLLPPPPPLLLLRPHAFLLDDDGNGVAFVADLLALLLHAYEEDDDDEDRTGVTNNEALWFRDAFAGVVVADVSANADSSFMRASISAIRTQATG